MRKKVFLIMIGISVLLAVSVCSSFAQDIDISDMDNAHLTALLQAIMEKLEGTADGSPEAPAAAVPGTADTPEPAAEANGFQIYKNKKLVIGRMPDWYFIRDDSAGETPDEEKPDDAPYNCIICPQYDIETGEGIDCFSIC
ncbi:MAG: hypothetical protein IKP86_08665 [Anaerolineaceae bacterium]|nr:hypothetical protein [Anaerolineaceae bacterium]